MLDQARFVITGGVVVGWVTSGGYAHSEGESVVKDYVTNEIVDDESGWSIELIWKNLAVKRQEIPLFDANSSHMRS